jgi:quercetin dioxygenase-like cupin family protein
MKPIPFTTINWDEIPRTEYKGFTGTSFWKTVQYQGLRIRIVEYSEGYLADHWCQLGHIVYCLEGKFESELDNGDRFLLEPGMSYVVSDKMSSHRSVSEKGVKLLIIDGDFLDIIKSARGLQ